MGLFGGVVVHVAEASRVVVGKGKLGTLECEVSVLGGVDRFADEPDTGHPEMGEEVGAVVEDEVE